MIIRDRVLLILTVLAIAGLAALYARTATPVTVAVDGRLLVAHTHRTTVGDLLREMGIEVAERDAISPSPSAALSAGSVITVRRARPVTLHLDGRVITMESQAESPAALLAELGERLHPKDLVQVNGRAVSPSAALQGGGTRAATSLGSVAGAGFPLAAAFLDIPQPALSARPAAVVISVRRAVPVLVSQDGMAASIMSPGQSVGEALFGEGIYVYSADIVNPPLDTPLSSGMSIFIKRAKPVQVMADGRTFATRTQAATVAAMLASEGIPAQNKDYSEPPLDTPIAPGLVVRVTRVREETLTESEFIAFKTIHQPDRNLELDQQRIVTPGKQGVRKRTINVRFENNKEVQRTLEREWIDEEPATQVVAYGTRVVVRTLNTPQGPVDYWRELRVWATYYTAATSGKGRDHPQYGITRTGLTATKGVIAVDPIAIRLHTPMYVPGYGFGKAEDTGGLILGMHIDLCFDEHDPNPQHMGWVTAYLLTPVPSDIPYLLPDYPRERR